MPRPEYSCLDLVHWIGRASYPTIEDFVKEASLRGCSRRMPDLPEWVRPGKTRIFLVHKGDQKSDDARGVFFGYYRLGRIQSISPHPFWKDPHDWVPVWEDERRRPPPSTTRRQFRRWIVEGRHVIVQPRRRVRHEQRDPLLDELWEELLQALLEEAFQYVDESWVDDEPGRGCGVRSAGGPYLLDDLAGAWFDWWRDAISELWDGESGAETPIVDHGHSGKDKKPLPPRRQRPRQGFSPSGRFCNRCAPRERLGGAQSLILFEQPYPVYHRPPKALFRGYDRLDGDALLLKIGSP